MTEGGIVKICILKDMIKTRFLLFALMLLLGSLSLSAQTGGENLASKGGFTLYPISQQFGFRNSPQKKLGFEVNVQGDAFIVGASFVQTLKLNVRAFLRKKIGSRAVSYLGGGLAFRGFLSDPLAGVELIYGAEVFPFNDFSRFSFIGEITPGIFYGVGDGSVQIKLAGNLGMGFYLRSN